MPAPMVLRMQKLKPFLSRWLPSAILPGLALIAGACSSGNTPGSGGSGAGGGGTGGERANTGGATTGGTGGTATGGSSTGGSPTGGSSTGGSSGGANGTGGAGGAHTGGAGGGSTGTGGSASSAYKCPAGPFTGSPVPSGATPTRIADAPPKDTFNMNGFTNVEGPVWIGDTLYFSEMLNGDLPASRILAIGPGDKTTVFIDKAGSNGLAVDGGGNLVSANHGAQGIVRFALPSKTPTTLVSMYMNKKFNCPNDLAVASDGTIYFTDPSYQNNANPQGGQRVYQLLAGAATATVVTDYTNQPNGISLSLDEKTLIVAGGDGIKKYGLSNGTVEMKGTALSTSFTQNTDGMVLDCAGNIYVAVPGSKDVRVFNPSGMMIATITIGSDGPSAVTNVAFGGADHQTLYITGQGNVGQAGVFKVHLSFPGMPY